MSNQKTESGSKGNKGRRRETPEKEGNDKILVGDKEMVMMMMMILLLLLFTGGWGRKCYFWTV